VLKKHAQKEAERRVLRSSHGISGVSRPTAEWTKEHGLAEWLASRTDFGYSPKRGELGVPTLALPRDGDSDDDGDGDSYDSFTVLGMAKEDRGGVAGVAAVGARAAEVLLGDGGAQEWRVCKPGGLVPSHLAETMRRLQQEMDSDASGGGVAAHVTSSHLTSHLTSLHRWPLRWGCGSLIQLFTHSLKPPGFNHWTYKVISWIQNLLSNSTCTGTLRRQEEVQQHMHHQHPQHQRQAHNLEQTPEARARRAHAALVQRWGGSTSCIQFTKACK
jgi:hypothetical protein